MAADYEIVGWKPVKNSRVELVLAPKNGECRRVVVGPYVHASGPGAAACISTPLLQWTEDGTNHAVGRMARPAAAARKLDWREVLAVHCQRDDPIDIGNGMRVRRSCFSAARRDIPTLAIVRREGKFFMIAVLQRAGSQVSVARRFKAHSASSAAEFMGEHHVSHVLAYDDSSCEIYSNAVVFPAAPLLAVADKHPAMDCLRGMTSPPGIGRPLGDEAAAFCTDVAVPFSDCMAAAGTPFSWPQIFGKFPFTTAIRLGVIVALWPRRPDTSTPEKIDQGVGGRIACPRPGLYGPCVATDVTSAYPNIIARILDATQYGPAGEWFAKTAQTFLDIRRGDPACSWAKAVLVQITGLMYMENFAYACPRLYLEMTGYQRGALDAAAAAATSAGHTTVALQTDSVLVATTDAAAAAATLEAAFREKKLDATSKHYDRVAIAHANCYVALREGATIEDTTMQCVEFCGVTPSKSSCPRAAKIVCFLVTFKFFDLVGGPKKPTRATLKGSLERTASEYMEQCIKGAPPGAFLCGPPDGTAPPPYLKAATALLQKFRPPRQKSLPGAQLVWLSSADGPCVLGGDFFQAAAKSPAWRDTLSAAAIMELYVTPFLGTLVDIAYPSAKRPRSAQGSTPRPKAPRVEIHARVFFKPDFDLARQ